MSSTGKIQAGIENLGVFGASAALDVLELAARRHLDPTRFANLLMKEKAVALPCEDPVTFAVNAAKPIIDAMSPEDKARIELLITCSESGIDFGKSLSTYVHHHLGLNRHCRMMELKQACYSGTAGLQMAVNFILSQTSPGAKALVIASDISRYTTTGLSGEAVSADWAFAEPTAGAGAVALLVGEKASILQIDQGASGYHGYEVMDTCRPMPDSEAGDADLSLLSYLDCCEAAYDSYRSKVADVDYASSFDYLVFHTPFGGMVKGAHRTMMRKHCKAAPDRIDLDFQRRVAPGLTYCQRVGNIMGGTIFLALAGVLSEADFSRPGRIGLFSYGSGCCSEFYSGVVLPQGQALIRASGIQAALDGRYSLSFDEYEMVLRSSSIVKFGVRDVELKEWTDSAIVAGCKGAKRLYLSAIKNFHREYSWSN
jgi:polyketide biosynthesis 3-hydroxy-3-methylglutaryl-CoA synthase-like enzyme PksG